MEIYTRKQVANHCHENDLWVVSGGKVYDLTYFKHPGGKKILLEHGGQDISRYIVQVKSHGKNIDKMIKYMNK